VEANLKLRITRGAQAVVHKRNQAWWDEKGLPHPQTAKALGVPIVLGRALGIYLDAEFGGSKPRNGRGTTRQSSAESPKPA